MKEYIFVMAIMFSLSTFGADIGNDTDAIKAANNFNEVQELLEGTFEVDESAERTDNQSFKVTFRYKKRHLGVIPHSGIINVKVLAKKCSSHGLPVIKYKILDVQKFSPKGSSRRIAIIE
jgi:hypothetical protein